MDQRRSFTTFFPVRFVAVALLLFAGLAAISTGRAAAQQGDGTITVNVHSCPPGFTGTSDQQFLTNCNEETGLYGVPLEFALPPGPDGTGTTTILYSQPNGAGGALPMTLDGIEAGVLTISEVSSARSPESVVFCTSQDKGGVPIIESAPAPVINGSVIVGFNAGWQVSCNWYRYPTNSSVDAQPTGTVPDAKPTGTLPTSTPSAGSESNLTLYIHSCPDDFDGTGFYQFTSSCTSETGLYGVPMQVIWPESTGGILYSQPGDGGIAVPMQFSTNATWPANSNLAISEIYTPRLHDPRLFCSQSAGATGLPILDGEEIPITDLSASIPVSPGDTLTCDWFRFPGGASGIETQDLGAGDGTIVINKWICDQAAIDAQDAQALPAANLETLKDGCHLADKPVNFFLDKQYILALDGESTVGVSWTGLFQGEHTVEEYVIPGFGEPAVICEGNVPGRQYIQPNIFVAEVTDLEITYDLAMDETLTCDWFNVLTDESDTTGNGPMEQATSTATRTPTNDDHHSDEDDHDDHDDRDGLTPDATVEHNGNDVFLTNDSDDDGLLDEDEINTYGTNPESEDTDSDGLDDFGEVMLYNTNPLFPDTDGDGLTDGEEAYTHFTDPLNADTDGDGVSDGDEVGAGTDPSMP